MFVETGNIECASDNENKWLVEAFIDESEKLVLAKRDMATWVFWETSRNWLRVRSRNIRVHLAINVSRANVGTWARLQEIPLIIIGRRAPIRRHAAPRRADNKTFN